MNWKKLPLNTGNAYMKAVLFGGCEIFVPLAEKATVKDVDKARKELHTFIQWQEFECLHGDDQA